MAAPGKIALIATGPTRPELLDRLPALLDALGPVASASPHQASRVCNALRAGRPYRDWTEFTGADAVFVAGLRDECARLVEAMLATPGAWKDRLVIFVTEPAGPVPEAVRASGMKAAEVRVLPVEGALTCAVAGDAAAHRLLRAAGARVIGLETESAAAFEAAVRIITVGLPQVLEEAAARLRECGLGPADAREVLDAETARAVRLFQRTRRKAPAEESVAAAAKQLAKAAGMT